MKKKNFVFILIGFITLLFANNSYGQTASDNIDIKNIDSTRVTKEVSTRTIEKNKPSQLLKEDQTTENKENSNLLQRLSNPVITNLIQLVLLVLQILIIIFGLKQFRYSIQLNRRGMIYTGFIDIEDKINEKNKLIWSLNEKNEFLDSEGVTHVYSLEEIKHMVQLIDLFAFERGQTNKYSFTPLKPSNVIYKMFRNNKYILVWNYVVKPNFFEESRFSKVIDLTIKEVVSSRKRHVESEESEPEQQASK